MADRTSARVFGEIFTHLAENPDERNKELALWLWDFPMKRCDFHPCQMECDEILKTLGLYAIGKSPYDYEGDYEVNWLYRGEEGSPEKK